MISMYMDLYIYSIKVRKLVLVWKFKSVIFIFGRLVDSVSSFEFN